ncbi:hypothetical protein [Bifidobacterium sp. ESL0704]|uniref:hypothetical protein n=1 Tax=Bifidobacterium sp. ESL0704 TaxID=2983219 RepID=UPI0023F95E8B|nr:hypothetical protein [Bifidobacterium sp. ESL0704]WEV52835.1 hypothetical protein OZX64_08265 [Bifidobacterium sp. ESL0704]
MSEIKSNEASALSHTHALSITADDIMGTVNFGFSVSNLPAAGAAKAACSSLETMFRDVTDAVHEIGHESAETHKGLSQADQLSAGAM